MKVKFDKNSFIAGYKAHANRADRAELIVRDADEREALNTEAEEAYEYAIKESAATRR